MSLAMILPTRESFKYVTNLEAIDVGVDVIPKRSANKRMLLYGKDLAALMEHSGVRKHLLDGVMVRNAYTIIKSDYSYEKRSFPVSFRQEPRSEDVNNYCPFAFNSELFKREGSTQKFYMNYYKTMFPQTFLNPTFDEVELSDYKGLDNTSGIMKESTMLNHLNDMKIQMYAVVDLKHETWWNIKGVITDERIPYDEQESGVVWPSNENPFSYYVWSIKELGETRRGSSWVALQSPQGLPYTITIPTYRNILKAQLVCYIPTFGVEWSRITNDGNFETERFETPPSAAVISTTEGGGTLNIDQQKIMEAIKRTIIGSGHEFMTINDIMPAGYKYGDYGFEPYVHLFISIQLDDHTKWWE